MSEVNNIDVLHKGSISVKTKPDVKEPRLYKVIIHNDNYTTMDFVVWVIMDVFHKSAAESTKIMLEVHNNGAGIAGIYTYDIAVTKISKVHALAKEYDYPLRCSAEEA